ncbi:amidohydrolase family protein [Streptomyces sp. 21So2-11]|uniref:amidohydrolase family protein n=1 Tax=Streptomyces sp. 21So2-11 TaxID=3144408 RepID=UPI00321C12EB
MSQDTAPARRVIGVEEHAWTPELRRALLRWGGDATVNKMSSRGEVNLRLLDVGEERLARMDVSGVDMEAQVAVPLAREANDVLADAVRRHPDRFAAFATLPTSDPQAAAAELERAVTGLGHVGAMLFPRTGETYLDHASFRPIFEAAAHLGVPLYIHPAMPPRKLIDIAYSGFDEMTGLLLSTGGWGWHSEAGLATLRLILAGTLDRHPDLQIILGHWGEMLVPFADRADLLRTCSAASWTTSPAIWPSPPAASTATACLARPWTCWAPTGSCSARTPPTAPPQQATVKSTVVSAASTPAARSADRGAPAPSSTTPRSTSKAGTSSATSTPNVSSASPGPLTPERQTHA